MLELNYNERITSMKPAIIACSSESFATTVQHPLSKNRPFEASERFVTSPARSSNIRSRQLVSGTTRFSRNLYFNQTSQDDLNSATLIETPSIDYFVQKHSRFPCKPKISNLTTLHKSLKISRQKSFDSHQKIQKKFKKKLLEIEKVEIPEFEEL